MTPVPGLRRLLEQPGAEHALDGAQIAAGLAHEIALERLVAERRRIVIERKEQRRWHRRRAALDRQQTRPIRVADADGGIRSAKIDAARRCHAQCSVSSYCVLDFAVECGSLTYRRSSSLDKSAIFPQIMVHPAK